MMQKLRSQRLLRTGLYTALLFLIAPGALAQNNAKVPREVIDHAAANGTALVLVGLTVPWEMESKLSEDKVRAQRVAIASLQSDLLTRLEGTHHKVLRRYQVIPGIALEVGADALAELARLPIVTNVLLDRPVVQTPHDEDPDSAKSGPTAAHPENAAAEKVPAHLFKRAATDGTVLVLAGLRAPWQREELLNENLLALQRAAIHDVQSYVLAELNGTRYRVTRLYRKIPGIALRVGFDALKILERSPAVTNVIPDRPVPSVK